MDHKWYSTVRDPVPKIKPLENGEASIKTTVNTDTLVWLQPQMPSSQYTLYSLSLCWQMKGLDFIWEMSLHWHHHPNSNCYYCAVAKAAKNIDPGSKLSWGVGEGRPITSHDYSCSNVTNTIIRGLFTSRHKVLCEQMLGFNCQISWMCHIFFSL